MVARKKTSAKKPAKKVSVCPACHSPHAEVLVIDGVPRYVCQRCGHVSKVRAEQSVEEAKGLVRDRRRHLVRSHAARRDRRFSEFSSFVDRYALRLWFKVISTMLVGFGLVLLPSVETATGVLFLVVGIIGLYAGLKWF